MDKIRVVLVGAGSRGSAYTDIMARMPERFEVVAVAEPVESRRNYIKQKHNIPSDKCFSDWKPLFDLGKIADMAVIATMDRDHFAPAMRAIELKYDLMLEKPIAPTARECRLITESAVNMGVKVVICTVLRYTDIFKGLKNMIDSGKIGKVMSVNHEECVGNVHQSHSFVRGNWGNSGRSSSMILQKSCHDIDILQWLIGTKCKKVTSFGSLSYFKEENAPEGAPEYCIDGCPHSDTCPYNAVKLYLDDKENMWFRTSCTKEVNPTDEQVENALRTTQYGKCVYKCDNDVVDHQTVNMFFEGDVTVTFTMNAFNEGGRFIHIVGTEGEIHASIDGNNPVEVFNFKTRQKEIIPLVGSDGVVAGHAGGDDGIILTLHDYLTGNYNGNSIPEIEESCYSHMITLAIEEAREKGCVVDVDEFIKATGWKINQYSE